MWEEPEELLGIWLICFSCMIGIIFMHESIHRPTRPSRGASEWTICRIEESATTNKVNTVTKLISYLNFYLCSVQYRYICQAANSRKRQNFHGKFWHLPNDIDSINITLSGSASQPAPQHSASQMLCPAADFKMQATVAPLFTHTRPGCMGNQVILFKWNSRNVWIIG